MIPKGEKSEQYLLVLWSLGDQENELALHKGTVKNISDKGEGVPAL